MKIITVLFRKHNCHPLSKIQDTQKYLELVKDSFEISWDFVG